MPGFNTGALSQVFDAVPAMKVYANAESRLGDILNAGGLTPQQRAMLSAAMNRQLGLQAEAAGETAQRRAAAQGIAGTGIGNAMQGNVLSGLLAAQQEGEEGLNKYSLELYQNALQTLFGGLQRERDRQAQRYIADSQGTGLGGFIGGLAGSFLGPLGSTVGAKLGDKLFG